MAAKRIAKPNRRDRRVARAVKKVKTYRARSHAPKVTEREIRLAEELQRERVKRRELLDALTRVFTLVGDWQASEEAVQGGPRSFTELL